MSAASGLGTPPAPAPTETLKRVKQAEEEAQQRIEAARRAADERLRHAREESETSVRDAATTAEVEGTRIVDEATRQSEAEAKVIEADGERAAAAVADARPALTPAQRDAVLAAILGDFR